MKILSFLKRKLAIAVHSLDKFISKIYFNVRTGDLALTEKKSRPFLDTSLDGLPEKSIDPLQYYNNIEQSEYLYELKGKFFIEPFNGWILDKHKQSYLAYSFPYSELRDLPSFYNIKLKRNKILKLKKVISLQYNFRNYWHFFNDVLGQIAFIDQFEKDQDVPLLVPAGVLNIPYVKEIVQRSDKLRNRNWIVHDSRTIVEAETVVTAKNLPNTKENFIRILNLLDIRNEEDAGARQRKIFVKRQKGRSRVISNSEEIEALLEGIGFEIIDNDLLGFEEQLQIYKSASVIVGSHGAGLTNLIFCYPLKVRLIEILPGDMIFPHYYWLCNQLGFVYDCFIAENSADDKFYLDPDSFLAHLQALNL